MQRYIFAADAIFRGKGEVDQQAVGEVVAALERSRTRTEPINRALWRAAKDNPDHPAFMCFTWEVQEACEKCWDDEGRAIIRSIRIVDDTKPSADPVRAFHSIVTPDAPRRYYSAKEVRRSADLQISLLKQAQRDLEAFEKRYREIVDVCQLIASARRLVERKLEEQSEKV